MPLLHHYLGRDPEARRIAERHHPDSRPGSLAWLFVETGAIPAVPALLLEELAIIDGDDRVALHLYLEARGPRESLPGWDRISGGVSAY